MGDIMTKKKLDTLTKKLIKKWKMKDITDNIDWRKKDYKGNCCLFDGTAKKPRFTKFYLKCISPFDCIGFEKEVFLIHNNRVWRYDRTPGNMGTFIHDITWDFSGKHS